MEDLVVQEVKLTYCFYENPAAKQEIKFWESLVEDSIKSKSFIGDNWGYRLEKDGEIEFVCCIPLQDLHYNTVVEKISNDVFKLHQNENEILTYHKTLIFGKVETDQLRFISTKMMLWEE